MITKDITIINKLGLHARAAAKLVELSSRYGSHIIIRKINDELEEHVNAKSIMSVLTLAASKGTSLQLLFDGDDETDASEAICALINDKFGENE